MQNQKIPISCPNTALKQAIQQQINNRQQKQSNKKRQQTSRLKQNLPQMLQDELKVLQAIELYQSKTDAGYMGYEGWVNVNVYLFDFVRIETVNNLWKIIRLINYGEVMIPTGLIYQIFIYFTTVGQPKFTSLKSVINSFLSINQKNQSTNNFRQLSNYPTLESIQRQYCFQTPIKAISKGQRPKNKGNELHERLFKEGKKRDHSLQKLQYASIANQLKQCQFTPHINPFNPKQQLKKRQRTCRHEIKVYPQQEFNHNFKARQIDKQIYKSKVEQLIGVREHIKRVVGCQAERQRIHRYLNKPWLRVR